jgi:hypothetical protein
MSLLICFRDEIRFQGRALRLILTSAAVAGAASVVQVATGRMWPYLSVLVAAGVLAVFAIRALGTLDGSRRIFPGLAVVASALMGCFTLDRLAGFRPEAAPVFLCGWAILEGAAFGLVGCLGLAAAHISLGWDRIGARWRSCEPALTGEARLVCGRGLEIWRKVETGFPRRSPIRQAMRSAMQRLLAVADGWLAASSNQDLPSEVELATRMTEIREKLASVEDPVARARYGQTQATLSEQMQSLRAIRSSRERMIAQMHQHVAAMDRLHFAGINYRSADASRLAAALAPILDDLGRLGEDMDSIGEGLREADESER